MPSDGRVITAIEFISPWNKIGARARERYTRKQLDYLDADVNLVGIDLIARGEYVLAAPLEQWVERFPERQTPYAASVSRWIKPHEVELYPIPLQDPLPNIRVPLRPHEPDIVLMLQPLLDQAYHDGRYHRINYQQANRPSFDNDLEAWMEQRIRTGG